MKLGNCFLIICMLLTAGIANAQDENATIRVYVSNLRNDEGQVAALLFSSDDGFPGEQENAIAAITATISDGEAILEFEDIPFGNYAVSVVHDEDMSESMNKNFMGIPSEGYWISNNERGGAFGGPNFDNASFTISDTSIVLIAYFNY